ncbi:P-loop containing nucleoside triphosphate hydrolase protein [Cokeromyces recurvatus]|uniref:P-loop containing nucleoside triphosphate hydrolase protein n=1 Tax=Cokeromyces recurvatus TaxID=90255 RepID=UPI0022212608|nr:P-loop containing nucleoside triphosphate hydrolase protein [Cokeromyces recurvatus]KAI7899293.1 P-loop containing nucleoside triphosphate hydrolase protein [Cokeromyces recurvatus]
MLSIPSQANKLDYVNGGGSFIHSYGSKTFMRPKLDDVLDAVVQAKFNEKRWVWIEDDKKGYVRGHIINEDIDKDAIEIEYDNGGTAIVSQSMIQPMNPPKFDMVDDMAELTHLNEPSVIHNLTVRYKANHVYTYSGLFLVAVNPYRNLPIYSNDYIEFYKGKRRGEMPPHIYAVADQAYHDMVQDKENQSILITGESGAGKTENTKIVIQYLTAIASTTNKKSSSENINRLQNQILQANPILESFGNAQTIRNNNSSRFGKFIRIEFNHRAQICGANIEWYLLEKSRVHHQTLKERNYHIFYQLLEADDGLKKQLLLDGTVNDYNFIKHSNKRIEGVDDAEEYQKLSKSLDIMGLTEKEKLDLFRIVASILHLGNISVIDYRDRADIRDFAAVERVCHLLGISAEEFKKSLLAPRIKAGRDWVTQAKSSAQVIASIDALAKTLYERNFAYLVEKINKAIDSQKSKDLLGFIGVLDIAGFEIFESNSFEQLCINYTNEKLQQFFNQNMFELEQEEYQKEKISWDYIDFGKDLQPTIDLIEKSNPVGILSCLEEECVAPRGSDQRFLEKLNRFCDKENPDAKYRSTRFKDGFILKHYAGDVEYSVDGWIEKNKDPLNEDITRLLARSNHKHVADLFEDYLADQDDKSSVINGRVDSTASTTSNATTSFTSLLKFRKGSGSFRTVGQRHKQQLLSLMNTLHMTHPHFVRCILPNSKKYPGEIQTKLVLDQLRCNGVLEGIRICRKGFPNRLSFDEFRKRYKMLCPELLDRNAFIDGKTACQMLVKQMNLESDKYQIGTTKIFFKATVLASLEELCDNKLSAFITRFQAMCRGRIARQYKTRFSRQTDAIRIIQRNARIYITLKEWPWWRIYAKLKPLNAAYRVDSQLREKEQRITALESEIKEQHDIISELMARNQQLEGDHVDFKELIMTEQNIIQELEETKESLLNKFTVAEERIEELELEIREKTQQMEEQQKTLDSQEADIEELNTQIDTSKLVQERLSVELQQLKEEIQTLHSQLEAVQEEKGISEKNLALLQSEIDKSLHNLEELGNKVNSQDDKISQLESGNKEYEETLSIQNEEIEKLKEALRISQENEKKLQEENASREAELIEIRTKLDTEVKSKEDWQAKYDHLKEDWDELTALVRAESDQARARMSR